MFQRIDEKISVAGVYAKASFIPKRVLWGEKVLEITEITLVSDLRDGEVKKRMYSFVVGKDLYRMIFNRDTEVWILEEIWVE